MSVTTTCDEKIKRVKELILEINRELLIVLDEDTWGHNDYNEQYMDTVMEVMVELLKIKRKL